MSTSSLQPWWKIAENDAEKRLFRALARHEKASRSTDGLVSETKLSKGQIEEIIDKYVKIGMISSVQSKDGGVLWQYWERAPKQEKTSSIAETNKSKRIKEANP
jgi:predicted transcriptional regulator